mmetsp:Transcript_48804/g.114646  ORF Transcript_48804/g.114646 Transcript_48804/m.114646 type:complete len:211 (-) Transcript_48804:1148-1780(-)
MQHSIALLLAHHELVIGGGHFERFLHKHGIDDANRRKADDELICHGEDAVVLCYVLLQDTCCRRPIRQGEFKHGEHRTPRCSEIFEHLVLLVHRFRLIFEVAVQCLIKGKRNESLHHHQQHKRPKKHCDASLHSCRHDIQGIKALNSLYQPQETQHSPHSEHSEKALIQLRVGAQGLLHQPKHDQGRVKPIPWVLDKSAYFKAADLDDDL